MRCRHPHYTNLADHVEREHGAVADSDLLDFDLERRFPWRIAKHGESVLHCVEDALRDGLVRRALVIDEHDARSRLDLARLVVHEFANLDEHVNDFDALVDVVGDAVLRIVERRENLRVMLAITRRRDAAKTRADVLGSRGHGCQCVIVLHNHTFLYLLN